MMQPEYNVSDLLREAQTRWLKPAEVLFILQNHEKYKLTSEPPQLPASGSLFLFNKRVLRFFRRDGHRWRKKKDGRTVGEAHERLKVGNAETLNCYYAHGEDNPNFQRRSYWMLDPAYEHIVLVHYREISEGKLRTGSVAQSPVSPPSISHSPYSNTSQNQGSTSMISDVREPYHNLSSPGSVEVSSGVVIKKNGMEGEEKLYGTGESDSSSKVDVTQALRRLEEQLSLNEDSFDQFVDFNPNGSDVLEYTTDMINQDQFTAFDGPVDDHFYGGRAQMHFNADNSGGQTQFVDLEGADGNKEYAPWKELAYSSDTSSVVTGLEECLLVDPNEKLPSLFSGPMEGQQQGQWLNSDGSSDRNSSFSLPQEVDCFKLPQYSPAIGTTSDYYTLLPEKGQIGSLDSDISLTVAQKQKFTIQEISPEWGYATETTKVIIVGSFLCDPSESAWTCMFGDVEVPAQIIQQGVIRCEAPPRLPGKVTICITSGNRVSCSEVREFEYRVKSSSCTHNDSPPTEATKSPEEMLLLVRFVQMLMSDSSGHNRESVESESLRKLKADDDSWGSIINALLLGSGSSSSTVYWLLEELLKDKLQQWLSYRSNGLDETGCSLSKKEQGIIHMIAGLGFEWALNPILNCGVNINFRDPNGWTALHWAALLGREKMVAVLIASGASAGAVTDPNSQDPVGKTPAAIAAINGHKGLAGYLSERELTTHLSSLTLEESEFSKGSAEVEAEITVNNISNRNLEEEDQISLKNTLSAVRNVTQAAARIQSAFRAHSFRRRQQREADVSIDDYGISSEDIQGLSAMSKLTFRNPRDYNSAAVSIQKKYRGWKGRKDFLALRQKVVKIQAHVRGYQVRKNYKVLWAVGILDKVVLRWRRKGVGLRGFRPETHSSEESEEEDILKVFRKQKVDGAINEAVSRVLSMVESPDARQQYQRMLERYHQAKAELGGSSGEPEVPDDSIIDASFSVEDIDMYPFP